MSERNVRAEVVNGLRIAGVILAVAGFSALTLFFIEFFITVTTRCIGVAAEVWYLIHK